MATGVELQALQRAVALYRQNDLTGAETATRALIQSNPAFAEAWDLLGLIAERLRLIDAAIDCFSRAVALQPATAALHLHLGNACRVGGKLDAAIASYREVLRLQPNHPDALINLGIALANNGDPDGAAAAWEAALRLDPHDADALANLANLYRGQGRIGDGIELSRRALEVAPDRPSTHSNLGLAYEQQGRLDEAIGCYRRALAIQPRLPYTESNLLLDLVYHGAIAPADVFAEHARWGAKYEALLASQRRPHANGRDADRVLRVGYVSPDLRDHSIAFFMEPILANHDRGQVEVFCYSAAPRADDVTRRLMGYGHAWRSIVGVPDERAAEMIRADGIDVLVDLAVHTAGHRLLLFARKPAPVQATYLGYAGTTGLRTIDWRITDGIVDPPGLTESLHTERLKRLPRTQWCYQPPAAAPDVAPEPPMTRAGRVTFGCATNLAKLTPQVVALWSEVLAAVPTARLALKARSLADESTRKLVAGAFAGHGIDAERLAFEPGGDLVNYLAFFGSIDVCLDTFPFAGGTTTCHALWMGVPVVTYVGPQSVSRVGASVLTQVGLTELIAESPQQFVAAAVALAGDADRLRSLRRDLRDKMRASPLCDAPAFARDLEAAYRAMWRQWCASGG